jgi:hypothetical protein
MKPELVDASRRNKEADMKAMAVEKVPIKEETIMEEDIVSSVSPDRAVSSSIKTETPGRDDDLPFSRLVVDGYYGHMDDDRGSSSSGSQYGTSPRAQLSSSPRGAISPYSGSANPGMQQHFMASMMKMTNYMSQREYEKKEQQKQAMYDIIAKEAQHFERNMDRVGNSPEMNKEIIQQLVEERMKKQQTMAAASQEPMDRWDGSEHGTAGHSRWNNQINKGHIDNWQQEPPPMLVMNQQSQVSTIRANPRNQQSVISRALVAQEIAKQVNEDSRGSSEHSHFRHPQENLEVQIETMDTAYDGNADCATGLCTAISDQSGPEYKDISRLYALSNLLDFANGNASAEVSQAAVNARDSIQRISVIQTPGNEHPRLISEEDAKVPLKKRICTKMCKTYFRKFLYAEPIMQLTFEEKRFIDKRVIETRALVKMVQPPQGIKTENPVEGLTKGRMESLKSFRENFGNLFGALRARNMVEIDRLGLLEARFLVCALTSIGVRMFGNGRDKTMLEQKHEDTYNKLMRSPWACSFEGEEKVQFTRESVGRTIGGDEKLEVLFTTCIMRGFQDPRSSFMQMESGNRHTSRPDEQDDQPPAQSLYDEPGHPARHKSVARCACEDPNLLTGGQFGLLLYRYLRDTQDKSEAAECFKKLEGLIKPLYECQNIFYYDRLPC